MMKLLRKFDSEFNELTRRVNILSYENERLERENRKLNNIVTLNKGFDKELLEEIIGKITYKCYVATLTKNPQICFDRELYISYYYEVTPVNLLEITFDRNLPACAKFIYTMVDKTDCTKEIKIHGNHFSILDKFDLNKIKECENSILFISKQECEKHCGYLNKQLRRN